MLFDVKHGISRKYTDKRQIKHTDKRERDNILVEEIQIEVRER
jgi:hypothetical protein